MHTAITASFGFHGPVIAKAQYVTGIYIQIDIGIASCNQIANVVILPGVAMPSTYKPGTVLRSATAKRAHGRGNKLPINLSSLAMQKQTEQAAAITNGLLNIAMQFITGICQ